MIGTTEVGYIDNRAGFRALRRKSPLFMRTAHISEKRHCQNPNCGRLFETWRGDQKYCCKECGDRSHRRKQPPKYLVVSVGTSAGAGYPFSVSIGGGAPEDDFFMFGTGFIAWPRKRNGDHRHFMAKPMRSKLSGSLRKQVWKIIESRDVRFHQVAPQSPAEPKGQAEHPKSEAVTVAKRKVLKRKPFCPVCKTECHPIQGRDFFTVKCDQCSIEYDASGKSTAPPDWKEVETVT